MLQWVNLELTIANILANKIIQGGFAFEAYVITNGERKRISLRVK